jgi:putative oxidoreductase
MPLGREVQRTLSWGCQISRGLPTIKMGWPLQRLFSTFPDGWPGFGILLLRLGAGTALICLGISAFLAALGEPFSVARDLVASIGGIFLLAGLWTPLMGALVAIDELWIALSVYSSQREGPWIHILLTLLTVAVAMLGPGAWSLDATPLREEALRYRRSKLSVKRYH